MQNIQSISPSSWTPLWLSIWITASPVLISKIKWINVCEASLNHIYHINLILLEKIQKQTLLQNLGFLGLHPLEALGDVLAYNKCTSEEFSRYQKLQPHLPKLNMLEGPHHLIHLI